MTTDALIIGPARLLIAAAGSDLNAGDIATLVAGTTPTGWTELGHTTTAVNLNDNPTYVKAMSQQSARALDVAISEIETTITTNLREVDAAKMAAFVNGTNASGTITPGGLGLVSKFAVALFGPGPDDVYTLLSAPRCAYVGERTVTFDAENFTEVAVTIEILDDTATGGYTIYLNN